MLDNVTEVQGSTVKSSKVVVQSNKSVLALKSLATHFIHIVINLLIQNNCLV